MVAETASRHVEGRLDKALETAVELRFSQLNEKLADRHLDTQQRLHEDHQVYVFDVLRCAV